MCFVVVVIKNVKLVSSPMCIGFFSDVFDDASEFQIELKAHDKRFEKRKTFLAT